jgi:hypothetical protein
MEAVGIEPTSEDKVTGISTGLACLLNLVLFGSNKQDLNETSRKISPLFPRHRREAILPLTTPSSNPTGGIGENGPP